MNRPSWFGVFLFSVMLSWQAAACPVLATTESADVAAMSLATAAAPGRIVPAVEPMIETGALAMLAEAPADRWRPAETPWNGVDLTDLAVALDDPNVFSPADHARPFSMVSDAFIRRSGVVLVDFEKK